MDRLNISLNEDSSSGHVESRQDVRRRIGLRYEKELELGLPFLSTCNIRTYD